MKKVISVLLSIIFVFAFASPVFAKANSTLNISKGDIGAEVSPTLYGVSIDDASFGVDGGLSSNMVNNNSFEYKDNPEYAWEFNGVSPVVSNQNPINQNNPTYETITVESSGKMLNKGYTKLFDEKGNYSSKVAEKSGMSFKKGTTYYFSCYLLNVDFQGKIGVFLDSKSNNSDPVQLDINSTNKNSWTKVSVKVKSTATENGGLGISFNGTGSICIDYVTLVPDDSFGLGDGEWKYASLRADMFEALKNLKPSFLKFPGDCTAENNDGYNWKDTIGEPALRRQSVIVYNNSSKGYFANNSNMLGYHEYFQLARDLNAVPVAVVGAGIACQTNGEYEAYSQALDKTYMTDEQWEAYLINECGFKKSEVKARTEYINSLGVKNIDDFNKYVNSIALTPGTDDFINYAQDILDLIEYANADSTAGYWASLRSANGSEQPFNLKYLQIGGDNYGETYWRNFDALKKIINEKYPDIVVIASTGYSPDGEDFDTAWNKINSSYSGCLANEKVVDSKDNTLSQNVTRYDSYNQSGAGVILDEYRSSAYTKGNDVKNNNMFNASQEASFITGLEKNSSVVKMASYSPTFSKIGANCKNQSLVWFDGNDLVYTPSYYTQLIFANNVGKNYVNSTFNSDSDGVFQSVTVDETSRTLYIKLVNTSGNHEKISVNLSGFDEVSAVSQQSVGSDFKSAFNSTKKQTVAPRQTELEFEDGTFDAELAPYSATVIRVGYEQNNGNGFYALPDNLNTEVKAFVSMSIPVFIIMIIALFVVGSVAGYFVYSKFVLKGKKPNKPNKKKKDDSTDEE
ncbi:alpha-L-arabinofuranosidase C-terminal domain-containing protein [uncultured Eubacterium sp.]|uniref:alpha-L-arabinofuranosidase C-terminal domain-containing protein n=1 Tax=uncultured Eubacterium sp. TaxID=165185 RepID=UPI0025FE2001|nr:alpha-L-arabinofuranosidase C-terminal domain-containing protein [uncultured Eubacterium sp.]